MCVYTIQGDPAHPQFVFNNAFLNIRVDRIFKFYYLLHFLLLRECLEPPFFTVNCLEDNSGIF